MVVLHSMFASLPRITEEREVADLLQQHFEREINEANARWDDYDA